jgi:hypothetical protein
MKNFLRNVGDDSNKCLIILFCLRQQSVTKPDTLCCEIVEPFIGKR